MSKDEFLVALQDMLQKDEIVNENDALDDYDEWDSLSKMAVMAYFQKNFGMTLNLDDLKNLRSVADLVKLAGGNVA